MAAGTVIKHKRKAGAFTSGQLQAGEIGVNTSADQLEFSTDGSDVVQMGSGYGPGGTDVAVADGGTGASTADAALTNLKVFRKVTTADVTTTVVKSPGTDITDLSFSVEASGVYVGEYVFIAKNSTAADGVKFTFVSSTATITSMAAHIVSTPPVSGVVIDTSESTALATFLTATTASTGYAVYVVKFTCVINGAGTLTPGLGMVANTGGTATLKKGSFLTLFKVG